MSKIRVYLRENYREVIVGGDVILVQVERRGNRQLPFVEVSVEEAKILQDLDMTDGRVPELEKTEKVQRVLEIRDLSGIAPLVRKRLLEYGINTTEDLKGWTEDDLVKIPGVGRRTAQMLMRMIEQM